MADRQCEAIAASGVRCVAPSLKDDVLCFHHAPRSHMAAQDARRKGAAVTHALGKHWKPGKVALNGAQSVITLIDDMLDDAARLPQGEQRFRTGLALLKERREWLLMQEAMREERPR